MGQYQLSKAPWTSSIKLHHDVTTARVTIRWVDSTQLLLSSRTIINLVLASMTIYNNNLPLCHWWQQLMLPLRACSHLNLSPPLASMAKGDINCISSQHICKQLPLSSCILIIWFYGPVYTNWATCSLSSLGSSMDPKCLRSWRDLKLGCPPDNHHLYADHQSLPYAIVSSSSSTLVAFSPLQLHSDRYLIHCLFFSIVHQFFCLLILAASWGILPAMDNGRM